MAVRSEQRSHVGFSFFALAFATVLAPSCLQAQTDAAPTQPPANQARTETSYLSLQQRVSELFADHATAVVRVKAAYDEGQVDGRPKVALRVGTGFFVSREGHVVTNSSITKGANRVWIERGDRSHAAEVLATDPDTNFALLRVADPPKNINAFALAPEEAAPPGTFALAITAPLDLAPAPAFGLVTGRDRGFAERTFPIRFLRVSIPANPGEGGAPVLDLSGRLIGMIIASIPELTSSYVLPVRALQRLRDDAVFHGGVRPGWVGLDLEERPLPSEPARRGVFVKTVLPETPAFVAGIATGDQLLSVDGGAVNSLDEFRESSFYARIGQVIGLRVRRAGEVRDVAVTVGAKPAPPEVIEKTDRPPGEPSAEPKARHPAK